MTVVLCSHLPGEGHFRSSRFPTVGIYCEDSLDYWRGMAKWWETDHVIANVEHDMQVSDELMQGLLDCPHPMCSWAYMLHLPSGGPHYAHRSGKSPTAGGEWVREGEQWADFGGIGFCKIAPKARVRPLEERPWQFVDCSVGWATDERWHLHWPAIDHYHLT